MANYKYCLVPCCKSSTTTCPEKSYFDVPRNAEIRKKWCDAMKRDEKLNPELSPATTRHVCQDHFDLEKDTENWMRHKLQGVHLKLKPGILPHRLDCQRKSKPPPPRTTGVKRKRAEILDALLSTSPSTSSIPDSSPSTSSIPDSSPFTSSIPDSSPSTSSIPDSSPSTSSIPDLILPPEDQTNIDAEVPEKKNKNIQTNLKTIVNVHKRSKGTLTKWPVVDRATSPLPSSFSDIGVSPVKFPPQPVPVGGKIYSSDSEDMDASSCSNYEQSNTEVEESLEIDLKSSMRKVFILAVEKNPRLCLGLPQECYFLIMFLEKKVQCRYMNIMITLKKIRLNDQYAILAMHFGLSKSSICRIFHDTILYIAPVMKKFIMWPTAIKIKRNLPIPFRARFADVQSIIDCFETKIEKPSNPLHQSLSWSEYKKANTLKYLVSCTPDGLVNFVSEGYGGRATDTAITEDCGFLKMLKPGMHVMADRGFKNISHILEKKGCALVRPPSVASNSKSTKEEVKVSKQIASLRIHVERVIGRLKEFKMLTEVIDHNLVQSFDSVVYIACALINLQPCLFRNDLLYMPKY